MNVNCLAIGTDPVIRHELLEAFRLMDKQWHLSQVDSVVGAVSLVDLSTFSLIICENPQYEYFKEYSLSKHGQKLCSATPVLLIGNFGEKTIARNGMSSIVSDIVQNPIVSTDLAGKILFASINEKSKEVKRRKSDLLSLLESVKKYGVTCTVFVFHPRIIEGKGFLYFNSGRLIDAQVGRLRLMRQWVQYIN